MKRIGLSCRAPTFGRILHEKKKPFSLEKRTLFLLAKKGLTSGEKRGCVRERKRGMRGKNKPSVGKEEESQKPSIGVQRKGGRSTFPPHNSKVWRGRRRTGRAGRGGKDRRTRKEKDRANFSVGDRRRGGGKKFPWSFQEGGGTPERGRGRNPPSA